MEGGGRCQQTTSGKSSFLGLATNALNVRNNIWEESYGRLNEWSEAYFVTLIDRCSFLCVFGQRGTIAKSMHATSICMT